MMFCDQHLAKLLAFGFIKKLAFSDYHNKKTHYHKNKTRDHRTLEIIYVMLVFSLITQQSFSHVELHS